ncbi:MAG: glutamine--fructose-6-phosphate transaminase (isomerizing) [Candidatus Dojkabacteria bacterium]
MCGIFGYMGQNDANDLIISGLRRLEYRGYDSWGVAILKDKKIYQYKNIGEIKKEKGFESLPKGTIGIGHTRWATHGGVTRLNAHPHISTKEDFTLVQNGIVENFDELKKALIRKKVKFSSETDTEVIVKLMEIEIQKGKSLKEAMISVFKKLKGRNTIAVLDNKGSKIFAIRNGSPLVLGVGKEETFLASDTLSFSPYTNDVILLDDFDMVEIDPNYIKVINIQSMSVKEIKVKKLKLQYQNIDKGKFKHFMLKEIVDQKETILFATNYSEKELEPLVVKAKRARKVYTIGAGTAGFAAGQIAYFLRNIADIDAQDLRSYEYRSYLPIINSKDLIIALSQSGETADTIEALEEFKKKGCKICSLVNMLGTTISRMSEYEFYTNSGPEICVASTKVFTAQCAWGYLLAMTIAKKHKEAHKNIKNISLDLNRMYKQKVFDYLKDIVKSIYKKEHMFILGKGENFNIALEGALKIKEISYKHVEGFASGELKHGVIALVEKDTPVFGIISDNEDSKDLISAMEQVKARGAVTIGVGSEKFKKNSIFDWYIVTPQLQTLSSISNVIPFQLLSYFLSVKLGNNIDKPRNLAKSVTVK